MSESVPLTPSLLRELGLPRDVIDNEGNDDALLVPVSYVDRSRAESIASRSAEVAGMLELHVHLLQVITPAVHDRAVGRTTGVSRRDPTLADLVARRPSVRDFAQALADPLRDWGMTMTIDGQVNDDLDREIIETADRIDANHLLLGRRRSPTDIHGLRGDTQAVLERTPCPVTILPPT